MEKLRGILRSSLKMKYLICYDVKKPKRLNRIAKVMKSYGERVQKSIFECKITYILFREMKEKINKIIAEEDSVRIYILCRKCESKIIRLGENHPELVQDEDFIFI